MLTSGQAARWEQMAAMMESVMGPDSIMGRAIRLGGAHKRVGDRPKLPTFSRKSTGQEAGRAVAKYLTLPIGDVV